MPGAKSPAGVPGVASGQVLISTPRPPRSAPPGVGSEFDAGAAEAAAVVVGLVD